MAGPLNRSFPPDGIEVEDLPPLARELVALAGFDAAVRLIAARPGIPVFIPQSLPPGHWLIAAVGQQAAEALVKSYGGEHITPPNCKRALAKIRHRRIRESRAEGRSQTEVALIYDLTPRQVRNIDSAEERPEMNLRLF